MFPASMDSGCGSDPPHRRRWTLPRAAQGGRAKAGAADPRTSSQRRLVATAALLARRLAEGAAAAAAARSWTEAPLSKRGSAQCSAALGWHGRAALPAFAAVLRGGRRRPGAGRGGLLPCRAGRPSRLVLPPPHSRVSAAVAPLHLSFRTPSLSPPTPHPHTPPMAVLRTYSSVTRAPGEVRGEKGTAAAAASRLSEDFGEALARTFRRHPGCCCRAFGVTRRNRDRACLCSVQGPPPRGQGLLPLFCTGLAPILAAAGFLFLSTTLNFITIRLQDPPGQFETMYLLNWRANNK